MAGVADLAVGLFGMTIGIASLWAGRKMSRRQDLVERWPTATATILSKEPVRYTRPGTRQNGRYWQEGVHYRFAVDGRDYESKGYSALQTGERHAETVQKRLDELPDEVTVHYNPADPSEAYIHTGSVMWPLMAHFGGGLALFIGFGKFAGFFYR